MIRYTSAWIVASLSTAHLLAAAPDLSKLPPASKQEGVTYAKDIQPLFDASCVRCHGADRPKGGLNLGTLEGVLKGSKDRKVIVPGDSEKSVLVIAVAQLDPRSAMPPKPRAPRPRPAAAGDTNAPATPPAAEKPAPPPPKPLTPEQVGLVRAWIDQGAK